MPKFRKKPVVIDAIRWDNSMDVYKEVYGWSNPAVVSAFHPEEQLYINTLEGQMRCDKGDWIIKGVNGELYPCKNDIFEKTYEEL